MLLFIRSTHHENGEKKQKRFQTVVALEESDKDARNMCKLNSILHIKTPVAQVWSRSVGHQLITSGC